MSYEMKPNSGSLFKNSKKESDKHPDYTGKVLIEGKEMYISAWVNESKSGQMYMSLKFQEPRSKEEGQGSTPVEVDSDLPF